MRLTNEGRGHITELNDCLAAGSTFSGIRYDSTQVNGGGFTEVIAPSGSARLRAIGYAGYWPGNFPDGQSFAMIAADNPIEYVESDMAVTLCMQLEQLTISHQALARYMQRNRQRPEIRQLQNKLGRTLIPKIIKECEATNAPLVYLMFGTWETDVPTPSEIFGAALHYPSGMHPNTALINLKANLPVKKH